jgi:hypothetical protein
MLKAVPSNGWQHHQHHIHKLNLLFFFKFNYNVSTINMAHENIETIEDDATPPI